MDASLRASLLAIDPATVLAGGGTNALIARIVGKECEWYVQHVFADGDEVAQTMRGMDDEPWTYEVALDRSLHPLTNYESAYPAPCWEPGTDLRDAMEALIAYAGDWSMECNETGVSVCLHKRGGWFGGEGRCDATTLAICRAILSAARTEAEAETVPDAPGKVS